MTEEQQPELVPDEAPVSTTSEPAELAEPEPAELAEPEPAAVAGYAVYDNTELRYRGPGVRATRDEADADRDALTAEHPGHDFVVCEV